MRKTTGYPTRRAILEHWLSCEDGAYIRDKLEAKRCWACGRVEKDPFRCHIVAASNGGDLHPGNFFLLCDVCHRDQPDTAPRKHQLFWLALHKSYAEMVDDQIGHYLRAITRNVDPMVLPDDVSLSSFVDKVGAAAHTSNVRSNLLWSALSSVIDAVTP